MVHDLDQSLLALYLSIITEMEDRPDDYKILAFLPTARHAQFLTAVLSEMGLEVMEIHSRIKQSKRTSTSDAFRTATSAILLSSDISARGVDYPNISLVIQIGAPGSKEIYVQRLGRTGRAGESGTGLLLLCPFEKPFLSQLSGLPIEDQTPVFIKAVGTERSSLMVESLAAAAKLVSEELAVQTYLAWLKNYNGTGRKQFKWSRQDLVDHANLFASAVLGRSSIPPVPRDVIVTMGLKDVSGLNLVDDALFYSEMDDEASLSSSQEEEDVWEMKIKANEIHPVFRQNGKAVIGLLSSLTSPEILALQTALAGAETADIGGFAITAAMVVISKKQPTITKNSSSGSLASSNGALSRSASKISLSSSLSSSSLASSCCQSSSDNLAAFSTMRLSSSASNENLVTTTTEAEIEAARARVTATGESIKLANQTKADEAELNARKRDFAAAKAELKRLSALPLKK